VKILASRSSNETSHTLLEIPREADPKVKNLTEFFERTPHVPLTEMACRMVGAWKTSSHFSAGSKVSQRLRYAARALRQSDRDASVRGLRFNPAA